LLSKYEGLADVFDKGQGWKSLDRFSDQVEGFTAKSKHNYEGEPFIRFRSGDCSEGVGVQEVLLVF